MGYPGKVWRSFRPAWGLHNGSHWSWKRSCQKPLEMLFRGLVRPSRTAFRDAKAVKIASTSPCKQNPAYWNYFEVMFFCCG